MKRIYLVFFISLFVSFCTFSQSNDNSDIESNINDSLNIDVKENRFKDSIVLINKKNEELRISREAYNSGLLLLDDENFIDAINYFSNAIGIDSMFSQAYFARGQCYHALDNPLAIPDYLRSFELDSFNLKPLYKLAEFQFDIDKNLSKQTYTSIISINKDEYKALAQLGIIAFLDNRFNDAEIFLTKSIEIKSTAYSLNDRASCYRRLAKFDLAIEDYLSAISLNPDLPFIYNNLASLYVIIKDVDNALKYYDKAILKDGEYVLAYNNKASILLEDNQYSAAEENIQKALSINPEYAPAFNNRGVLNHYYEKYDHAIADFDKAILLDNDYAKAYLNRGISKQFIRDEDGACLDWQKAKALGVLLANKYLANDCE